MKQINYDVIKNNIKRIISSKKIMLVIKENAYNFGLTKILDIALSLSIDFFSTNYLKEAIKIKKRSSNSKVLLIGRFPYDSINIIKKYNIIVSLNNEEDYKYILKHNLKYHIKVNTSMNRFGIKFDEIKNYINDNLNGVYIHLAGSDYIENTNTVNIFSKYIEELKLNHLDNHVGGSISLGLNHNFINRIANDIYKDSISYYADVVDIRKVNEGDLIGYEHNYLCMDDLLIAIVNVGYSHGLTRENNNNYVYINNKKYFFIGYKCMHYSFVVIDEFVNTDDKVEVIGPNIKLEEFSKMNHLINHQVYLYLK